MNDGFANLDQVSKFAFQLLSFLVLATARSVGISTTFSVFSWGRIGSGIIRMTYAICIGMPMVIPVFHDPMAYPVPQGMDFIFIIAKEFVIGAGIGMIASLPFYALTAAGNAIDTTRGVGGSIQSATGESSPFGSLLETIALWSFATMGGFWFLVAATYASYAAWPLLDPMPSLKGSEQAYITLSSNLIRIMAYIAAPLLALMMLSDLTLYISAKLGKRLDVISLSPMIKNFILLSILPFLALVYIQVIGTELTNLFGLSQILIDLGLQKNGR